MTEQEAWRVAPDLEGAPPPVWVCAVAAGPDVLHPYAALQSRPPGGGRARPARPGGLTDTPPQSQEVQLG